MILEKPLREGIFLKRYKRFFADVEIAGQVVTAHVPNTGSLKTCLTPGARCIVSESQDPKRKLKATLHFIHTARGWAGVNTSLPNSLVHEAWRDGRMAHWRAFKYARREYKISPESRLDLVLAPDEASFNDRRHLHHVEIKNVTFAESETARFPDAVSTRAQKHLHDLMRLKREGHGAEIVFVIQREGCTSFSPADSIDPEYGRLLRQARDEGVALQAFTCDFSPERGIELSGPPVALRL